MSVRNVRPAWVTARADGRKSAVALGPRSADGTVSGQVTLRTADGEVSAPIEYAAGWRPARFVLDVPAEMRTELLAADGSSLGVIGGRLRIVIAPPTFADAAPREHGPTAESEEVSR